MDQSLEGYLNSEHTIFPSATKVVSCKVFYQILKSDRGFEMVDQSHRIASSRDIKVIYAKISELGI